MGLAVVAKDGVPHQSNRKASRTPVQPSEGREVPKNSQRRVLGPLARLGLSHIDIRFYFAYPSRCGHHFNPRPRDKQHAALSPLACRLRGLWSANSGPGPIAVFTDCTNQHQRGRQMHPLQRHPPVSCRPILSWSLPEIRPARSSSPTGQTSLWPDAGYRRFHHRRYPARPRRHIRPLAQDCRRHRRQRSARQRHPRRRA